MSINTVPRRTLKRFKVLVGTPHNEVKNYCLDEWLTTATNLTYKNRGMLMVDNSPTPKNKKMLMKRGIPALHVKPKGRSNQAYIAASLEEIRQEAIRGKYDILLILEDDIIPPLDVIERLLVHQKQVVSASYFIGEGDDSHLMIQQAEDEITWQEGDSLRLTDNVKDGYDINYADGKLHKVYACGMGCMLIHHTVFKNIPFRYVEGANQHPDSIFAADLHFNGITQYVDTSILCKHRNQSWNKIADVTR